MSEKKVTKKEVREAMESAYLTINEYDGYFSGWEKRAMNHSYIDVRINLKNLITLLK